MMRPWREIREEIQRRHRDIWSPEAKKRREAARKRSYRAPLARTASWSETLRLFHAVIRDESAGW